MRKYDKSDEQVNVKDEQVNVKNVDKVSKIIRVITIPSVMATALLTILYVVMPEIFGALYQYFLSLLFIVVLPVLAYPIQPLVPGFRGRGRDGQRKLAILMSLLGYIGGILCGVLLKAPLTLVFIYLTYLFSGLFIFIFSKIIRIKASGHACGVAGPIAMLVYLISPWFLFAILILGATYIASLRMKRHTLPELILGSFLPIVAMLLASLCL